LLKVEVKTALAPDHREIGRLRPKNGGKHYGEEEQSSFIGRGIDPGLFPGGISRVDGVWADKPG
jgi:hypothetical protein